MPAADERQVAPSRGRAVHRALVVGKLRKTWPACGLGRSRWPSMEITTTTDPTKVTCNRKGCRVELG